MCLWPSKWGKSFSTERQSSYWLQPWPLTVEKLPHNVIRHEKGTGGSGHLWKSLKLKRYLELVSINNDLSGGNTQQHFKLEFWLMLAPYDLSG